ncbi:hypothetical protein GCM10025868_16950 [Angustibacter aerolatus]|uniref:Uncharacterized protein n=1 Tax=Angustibacter aerolatus TaxID=1162965 RepID=A0ABQ6JE34_9ACTN|nr:hypothetical protein GCM10025868_16950 [Angustibacter aerolatus]
MLGEQRHRGEHLAEVPGVVVPAVRLAVAAEQPHGRGLEVGPRDVGHEAAQVAHPAAEQAGVVRHRCGGGCVTRPSCRTPPRRDATSGARDAAAVPRKRHLGTGGRVLGQGVAGARLVGVRKQRARGWAIC